MSFTLAGKIVWVAGHTGLVGSALVRRLERESVTLLTAGRETLDLTRQAAVEHWMADNRPDVVFIAAAKVGGIEANRTMPAAFLYDNMMIASHIIHAAYKTGVEKLMFLGSSCIYPKNAAQPITEEALLTGPLEPTNEAYTIAKIAGVKLCQAYRTQHGCDFIAVMPTNLFGPNDNYHPEHAHVPAALMQRFHKAKINDDPSVTVWGTGKPKREFLYVDDVAEACIFLMKTYSDSTPVNIGSGQELTIAALAETVKEVVGYEGELVFDTSRPDGVPRKLLDSSKLQAMGWQPHWGLKEGLQTMYEDYLSQEENGAQERT